MTIAYWPGRSQSARSLGGAAANRSQHSCRPEEPGQTKMNRRGWKTLARGLVLARTGMRPSQVKRLDPDLDIRPLLDGEVPFFQVSAGKGGKSYLMPLTSDGDFSGCTNTSMRFSYITRDSAIRTIWLRTGARCDVRHDRFTVLDQSGWACGGDRALLAYPPNCRR